jgi:hypothetical protein
MVIVLHRKSVQLGLSCVNGCSTAPGPGPSWTVGISGRTASHAALDTGDAI